MIAHQAEVSPDPYPLRGLIFSPSHEMRPSSFKVYEFGPSQNENQPIFIHYSQVSRLLIYILYMLFKF